MIVGFPGETAEDFAATCRVARAVGFCKIHVFSYSPREGTSAATFTDQVPPAVVDDRRKRLRQLEAELAARYAQSLRGTELEVMVEGDDPHRPGRVVGTSCRSMPVSLVGRADELTGHRVRVRAGEWTGKVILGNKLGDSASPNPWAQNNVAGPARLTLPLVN